MVGDDRRNLRSKRKTVERTRDRFFCSYVTRGNAAASGKCSTGLFARVGTYVDALNEFSTGVFS